MPEIKPEEIMITEEMRGRIEKLARIEGRKIAVLTSGGDSPGMNTAVAAIVRFAEHCDMTVLGARGGIKGLCEADFELLTPNSVLDIVDIPGSYLRSARFTKFIAKSDSDPMADAYHRLAADILRAVGVAGLVVIGGDGSFMGAKCLEEQGIPCIGIPATVDGDLVYTEKTLGFDSCVNEIIHAIRSIRYTSRAHDHFHVVEVMGRNCGNLALAAAKATNADIMLVAEEKWCVKKAAHPGEFVLMDRVRKLVRERGMTSGIIVVSEGCWQSLDPEEGFDLAAELKDTKKPLYPGEKMGAERLAQVIEKEIGDISEVRHTVLGYTQRGCVPTYDDCLLAYDAGKRAVELLRDGMRDRAIGIRNGHVFDIPMEEVHRIQHDTVGIYDKAKTPWMRPFDREALHVINEQETTEKKA